MRAKICLHLVGRRVKKKKHLLWKTEALTGGKDSAHGMGMCVGCRQQRARGGGTVDLLYEASKKTNPDRSHNFNINRTESIATEVWNSRDRCCGTATLTTGLLLYSGLDFLNL